MATISIREYARRKGCSDTAVHKAIRAGKIVAGRVLVNGIPKIDPDVADKEWNVFLDPTLVKSKPAAAAPGKPQEQEPSQDPTQGGGGDVRALQRARLVKETSVAKLKDLEFKVKSGKLVDRDKVYSSLFSAGQEVRATVLAIPDRHIDEIFTAKTRNDAHTILANVLSDALEVLADISKREMTPRAA